MPASEGNIIHKILIAPCGMNCRLCVAYTREKNPCPGCRIDDRRKPKTRFRCRIKTCKELQKGKLKYCYSCPEYPCERLMHLDKRYRTRYGMSMLDNLADIRSSGIRLFLRKETQKWTCPGCGGIICVHKPQCLACGYEWKRITYSKG